MLINENSNIDFELPDDFKMKYIHQDIRINAYKISYSYKTTRENRKENHRYLLASSYEDAKVDFINYINDFNRNNEHRKVSNVKILGTVYIGTVTL